MVFGMFRMAATLALAIIGLVGITSQAAAKPSVFSLQNGFDETYCLLNASRAELPMIFETVIDYTGGNEAAAEKTGLEYRENLHTWTKMLHQNYFDCFICFKPFLNLNIFFTIR